MKPSSPRSRRSLSRVGTIAVLLLVPLSGFIGCSDDGDEGDAAPMAGRAGSDASAGNGSGEGGSDEPAGGRAGATGGGRSGAGVGGGSTPGGTGSIPMAGRGGSGGNGGSGQPEAGESSGGSSNPMPPAPGPDGKSAYAIECHGDSLDCDDPALRCLELRDAMTVLGHSCSNECRTNADCSEAPSGAQATSGCVDFTLAKYCMLICRDGRGERTCPTGMSCYEYPGAGIGYCLWR